MNGNYSPDTSGLRELGTSEAVGKACLAAAERGAQAAIASAPRQTGAYAASIRAERTTVTAGWNNEPRAGATVIADIQYAANVERMDRTLGNAIGTIESP